MMRVLVTGRNAKVLAQAAGALASDLTMVTATSKADALDLLGQNQFDLVLACERLGDGSGLEVLSHVAVNTPNTLRIFAARPATLELLKGELGLFGLFRALPYPINFRQLWAAIQLARSCDTTEDVALPPRAPQPIPQVRHVVLDGDWGEPTMEVPALRLGDMPKPTAATDRRASMSANTAASATAASTNRSSQAKPAVAARPCASVAHAAPPARVTGGGAHISSTSRSNANTSTQRMLSPAADAPAGVTQSSAASRTNQPPARIPESEAFKRAMARRSDTKHRREPSVSNESLGQLARLSVSRGAARDRRVITPGKRRTALFVGSGVFAAGAAGVLTFFMIGSSHSMGTSSLPLVASMGQSNQEKTLPWQASSNQASPQVMQAPTQQQATSATFVSETSVTQAPSDTEVRAEADSESAMGWIDPRQPPPPPPPLDRPGPAEPPSYDENGNAPQN
jgi:CheY-like chemotaxis protein